MRAWECWLPEVEAHWLSGPLGPLRDSGGFKRPGVITHPQAGLVWLDEAAFESLTHIGGVSGTQDGRVVFRGDIPVMVFGEDAYVLRKFEQTG